LLSKISKNNSIIICDNSYEKENLKDKEIYTEIKIENENQNKIINEEYTKIITNENKNINNNYNNNLNPSLSPNPNSNQSPIFNMNFEDLKEFVKTENFRDYNFDFNPKFLYSQSKATSNLSNSSASKYMEFISLKKIYLLENENKNGNNKFKFISTPCTKSEIFTSEDLDLLEKQKLLNFILAVMKLFTDNEGIIDVNTTIDFKKNIEMESNILQEMNNNKEENYKLFFEKFYSEKIIKFLKIILANIDPNDENDYKLELVLQRIYKHLSSLQIYDDCPLIYPNYGSSEFSQSLSRVSSVNGGIFIVNENLNIEIRKNVEFLLDDSVKKFVVIVDDSSTILLYIIYYILFILYYLFYIIYFYFSLI
jgi:RAB protein geranylgeranyltransferase component A